MGPKIEYNSLSAQALSQQQMAVFLLKPDECYPFTLFDKVQTADNKSEWKFPLTPAIRKPVDPIDSLATRAYQRTHYLEQQPITTTQQLSVYGSKIPAADKDKMLPTKH